jgi:hypothetical protein
VKDEAGKIDLRLIDAARVKRLPVFLTRRRWIVKDLAQFFYSTLAPGVTDEQRTRWLTRYGQQRGLDSVDGLRRSVERKVRAAAMRPISSRPAALPTYYRPRPIRPDPTR